MSPVLFYRIARFCLEHKIPFIPRIIYIIQFLIFGCAIPASCKIGRNAVLGYGGMGIVIHARAAIGDGCTISQQVTIGGRSGLHGVPVICDDVYIGAGAKILGPITVGNGSVIGANAVVICDVGEKEIFAGVPAVCKGYKP